MRDGFRCGGCQKLGGLLESHHIKSLESGGSHTLENGQTLCRDCHFDVHRVKAVDPQRVAWAEMLRDMLSTSAV